MKTKSLSHDLGDDPNVAQRKGVGRSYWRDRGSAGLPQRHRATYSPRNTAQLLTDVEGSTAMTERLGDQRAQEVLPTMRHEVVTNGLPAHMSTRSQISPNGDS